MPTLFVTGGTGFIGSELVVRAVAAGHSVEVLARSPKSQAAARKLGAVPVEGDLSSGGAWQERAAAAEWVAHVAQPQAFGGKVTAERAERYREERQTMDRRLLDPLRPEVTKKILYVAGTSYYGQVGATRVDEETRPQPKGWGPFIAPAIDALAGDLARGLPIVTAFPGYVYGDGSWFREYFLGPIGHGKKVTELSGPARVISPVHLGDCARALLHLLSHGEVGKRYFVVGDEVASMRRIAELTAQALGAPLRTRRAPRFLARFLLGPVVVDSLETDCALSNRRLKSTGFELEFPTLELGIPAVVRGAKARAA